MKNVTLPALTVLVVTVLLSSVASGFSLSWQPDINSSEPNGQGLQVWFDNPQFLSVDPCAYQLDVHAQTSSGLWITDLKWNFGDGSTLNIPFSGLSVIDDIRTHIYPATGTYEVSVVAYDNAGNVGSAGQTLTNVMPGSCNQLPGNSLSTISNAVVEDATSLQLPADEQMYLYGFVTAGDSSSTPFNNGEYVSVANTNGYLVAALATTASNSNYFTTQSSYYSIAAASISGYSSYSESYVSDSSAASLGVSDHFTVATSGSLVVVFALVGDEECLNVTGLPGFSVDASNIGSSVQSGALIIGHAYLAANGYVVKEQTLQCVANQNPNQTGNLIGVFIFQPAQSASPSPALHIVARPQP